MDETSSSSDDDYVENDYNAEPGPSTRWNLRKRKRESIDVTSAGVYQVGNVYSRPTSKTRRRDLENLLDDGKALTTDNRSDESPYLPGGDEVQPQHSVISPYIEIFNSTLNDFLTGQYGDLNIDGVNGDLGGWTAMERDKFYRGLQQLHFVDFSRTAQLTGKSVKEVQDYLARLEEKLELYRSDEATRQKLALPHEFPSAFEISTAGIALLDAGADRLRRRELRHEKQYAKRMYGRYAIIDQSAARDLSQMETWLELRLLPNSAPKIWEEIPEEQHESDQSQDQQDSELFIRHHKSLIEAAQLLRPRKFLELSECLFMNFGSPRQAEHWMSLSEGGEHPSMMRTAFIDFYSLTIRFIKKLVAASLFYAEARMKIVDEGEDGVSPRDVENAALDLGLTQTWKVYWSKVTQRCNIQVFDETAKPAPGSTYPDLIWLSPSQVEAALANDIPSAPGSMQNNRDSSSSPPFPDVEEMRSLPFDNESDPDAAYDDYVDAFDKELSRQHELGLFTALERQAPPQLKRKYTLPPEPLLHQSGDHAIPNKLRDLLERSSEAERAAVELSSIRTRRRSSGATTDRSSNIRDDEQLETHAQTAKQDDLSANEEAIVDDSAPTGTKSSQSTDDYEVEPKPRKWKGKERAVPFPTGISRVEDLIYCSDES